MGKKAVSSLREVVAIGQSQYEKCVDERVKQLSIPIFKHHESKKQSFPFS